MRHRSQLPYAAAGLQLRLNRRIVSFIQIMQTSQTKHLYTILVLLLLSQLWFIFVFRYNIFGIELIVNVISCPFYTHVQNKCLHLSI